MNNSRFFLLNRLMGQLPANAVEEIPLLATAKAYIGVDLGNDAEMYAYTQKALQMLAELSPASEAYAETKGEVNVLQSLIEIILGDAGNGLIHVEEGLKNLPDRALSIRSMGIGILSVCHQMKGNGEKAVAVIREGLSESNWPANSQARLHFCHAIEQYMDADLFGMMSASRECLRAIQDLSFAHTRVFANYLLGTALYQQNEPAAAESELLKVMEHPHAANPSYLAYAGFLLVRIHLMRGDEAAARQVLDLVTTHCRENGHTTVLSIAQAFEVEFTLLRGDIQQALRLCKQVYFDVRPPAWFHYIPQLTPIKCLLAQGTQDSLQAAHARLMELDDHMRSINRKNVRIEILVLLALVCRKQSDNIGAYRHLQTALALGEPGGWVRTFLDLGEPMAKLLQQFLKHHPAHTYARQVLDACLMPSRTTAPTAVRRPAHANGLTRRESEVLALLAEGLSNKEIAEKLFVSPDTIKTHVKHIFKKLNVKRRMEAVKIGLGSHNIVDD
jgi:LuxR family maltose regulon positive regulatory protein